MHFDLAAIPQTDAYKLLVSTVVPRPIALATTVDREGRINAAPFSFFNAVSSIPPVVVLGISPGDPNSPGAGDGYKDTERNIRDTGEFVVNLVDEALAERMNLCAVDFPPDVSEVEAFGLKVLPGVSIPVPHIADAPAALECRHYTTLEVSNRRHLIIGSVVRLHARPGIVDPERLHVNLDAYKPVARLFGNLYARLGEKFALKRQSFAEWQADHAPHRDENPVASKSPALAEERNG